MSRDQGDMADLSWDSFSVSPTYETLPNLPPLVTPYTGGLWPPRLLSSECHNQMEVTVLQGGDDRYFDGPVFSSPESASSSKLPNVADNGSASASALARLVNRSHSTDINTLDQNTDTVHPVSSSSDDQGKERDSSQPLVLSDTTPRTRSRSRASSRLKQKERVDYSALHSRGRTQSQ